MMYVILAQEFHSALEMSLDGITEMTKQLDVIRYQIQLSSLPPHARK